VSAAKAGELTNALKPLLGGSVPDFEVVCETMAEVLRRWQTGSGEIDWMVQSLVERMIQDPGAEIRDLVQGMDVGYRQILRRFEKETGLKPKEFMRLRRVRAACLRALESKEAVDWADVSATIGFSDQPHLSRELRWAFGWPPRLVMEYLKQIEHRDVHPNL
jgi:AraC-like DNA-binding protein